MRGTDGKGGPAAIAEAILGWLIADPARLSAFMIESGLGTEELRAGREEPALALAALDYLLSDEPRLLAACRDLELPPEAPARAQAALGGLAPHWT